MTCGTIERQTHVPPSFFSTSLYRLFCNKIAPLPVKYLFTGHYFLIEVFFLPFLRAVLQLTEHMQEATHANKPEFSLSTSDILLSFSRLTWLFPGYLSGLCFYPDYKNKTNFVFMLKYLTPTPLNFPTVFTAFTAFTAFTQYNHHW